MNTIPSPRRSGSEAGERLRRAAAALALLPLVMGFHVAAQEQKEQKEQQEQQEQRAAVWKVREVNFVYRSSIAIYDCAALRGRVSSIFRAIGARDDIQVTVFNCDDSMVVPEPRMGVPGMPEPRSNGSTAPNFWPGRSDPFPTQNSSREQRAHVRVRLMMPTEVTPEVLGELQKDKGRRELISRMTGNPAAKYDDPIVFAAKWQPVTLSHRSTGIEPEECELLEQMSTGVFRELGVRVVRRNHSCDRKQVSRIPPQLTVEALIGSTFESSGSPAPTAGESKDEPVAPATSDTSPAEPAPAPTTPE